MIGTVIHEQYRIQELMGEGGMGIVYKALDQELDRLVALKFLKAEFGDNQQLIKRFRDELKVLASFNHPNITMLYTSFSWQSRPVMVMELLEGEPLNRIIDRRGPIPANVCVPWVRQALAGVAEAHRRDIIHRDLKPANLMLTKSNVVKVMDFGIAKIENAPGLTRTSVAMGTPFYIAPEQIDPERFGMARVDARTDIYSMGVTLYELLAGEVPFKGATEFSIHRAHLEQRPDPPTIHYPHIPGPIVDAVLRAMAKDPRDRFQTVEEFSEAIGPAALSAPEAPAPKPAEAHVQATQTRVDTAVTTLRQSGTGAETKVVIPQEQEKPPQSILERWFANTRNPRLVGGAVIALILLLVGVGGFGIYILLNPTPVPAPYRASIGGGGGGGTGGAGGGGTAPSSHTDGGGDPFHVPSASQPETSNKPAQDIELPTSKEVPKDNPQPEEIVPAKPTVPSPSPAPPPPVANIISSVVAGRWSGNFTNFTDNSMTTASLVLSESAGDNTNTLIVSGTLSLQATAGAERCSVIGTYDKGRSRLILRASACGGAGLPAYLASGHATVLTSINGELKGTVQPDMGMFVSFKKM